MNYVDEKINLRKTMYTAAESPDWCNCGQDNCLECYRMLAKHIVLDPPKTELFNYTDKLLLKAMNIRW